MRSGYALRWRRVIEWPERILAASRTALSVSCDWLLARGMADSLLRELAMSEHDPTPNPADESDWPPRTAWLALVEQSELQSREWHHQEQLRSVERERDRKPEPGLSQRLGFWRRLSSGSKCLSCGHRVGLEEVPAWRDGWDTYRCRYCLTWTQKRPTPPEVMGW